LHGCRDLCPGHGTATVSVNIILKDHNIR
jgi:hypothetical protein